MLTDPDEIEEFGNNAIAALDGVFETIDEVHSTVVDAIGKELHGEAVSAFINETIQELDQIAGHGRRRCFHSTRMGFGTRSRATSM